jgi:hypothetical protein
LGLVVLFAGERVEAGSGRGLKKAGVYMEWVKSYSIVGMALNDTMRRGSGKYERWVGGQTWRLASGTRT